MSKIYKKIIIAIVMLMYGSSAAMLNAESVPHTNLYLKSYYAFKTGDTHNAILTLGKLINKNSADTEIYEKLISAYLIEDDFADAYNIAISMPNYQENKIASFIAMINEIKNNKFDLNTIIKNDSTSPLDKITLELCKAWIFYVKKQDSEAEATVENIINIKTPQFINFLAEPKAKKFTDILINYNLALLNYNRNADKALEYFRKALNLYDNSVADPLFYDRILINYVKLLCDNKKRAEAKDFLIKLTKDQSQNVIATELLKKINKHKLILDGTFSTKLNRVKQAKAGISEALSNISTLLSNFDGTPVAWFYDIMALQINHNNVSALWQYGSLLSTRNINVSSDINFAINVLNKIKFNSVYYLGAKIQQSMLHLQKNNYSKAINILHNLRIMYRDDKNKLDSITYFLSNIYIKKKDFKSALAVITHHLKYSATNGNWMLYYQAGVVNHQMGNIHAAIQDFKIALKKSPDNAELLNYYGYLLLNNKKSYVHSLTLLQKAAKLEPTNGYIMDSLGWSYFHNKDYQNAIKYLQLAVQLLPYESSIIEHLGDVYWKNNNYDQARYEWQNALNVSNDIKQKNKLKLKIKQTIKKKKK